MCVVAYENSDLSVKSGNTGFVSRTLGAAALVTDNPNELILAARPF